MRQKRKRKLRIYILVTGFAIVFVTGVLLCMITYLIKDIRLEYEQKFAENNQLIQQNTRVVYVAAQEIRTGEPISEDMVEIRRSLCSQTETLLFSQEDIGKIAVSDIAAGTFLNKSLVSQEGNVKGLREMCYRSIEISGNVNDYDVVDVRIRYPAGGDYVVLAGKRIRLNDDAHGQCYLWVTEEELLLMSAAMVDVEKEIGTYLYTSKYIEAAIQKKSVVTYQPCKEIVEIINQSPNIKEDELTAVTGTRYRGKDMKNEKWRQR